MKNKMMKTVEAYFVKDCEKGFIVVECQSCYKHIKLKDLPKKCTNCHSIMVYPGGASW